MVTDNNDGTATVRGPCRITKKYYTVVVPLEGLREWRRGKLIQQAMPDLSKEDREFLISGTSPEGWNQLFGDGNE